MADYPPLKNSAYKLIFPIFDSGGNLLSAAGSLVARVSKDGAAFAAATNVVAEIGTDAVYALDLTAAEMNADQIAVRVTSGGKPVYALIHAVVRQTKDLAFPNVSGRGVDVDATGGVETGVVGTGAISSLSFGAGAIDAAALATDATPRIVKNTAIANFMFLMVDSTDHVTPKTGLTWAAGSSQVSIDGAAFTNLTNLPVEVSAGIYKITLAAADMNGDVVTLKFTGTAADSRLISVVTQP